MLAYGNELPARLRLVTGGMIDVNIRCFYAGKLLSYEEKYMSKALTSVSEFDPVNGIQESISSCFKKYATFQGRAKRPEFWYFFLVVVAVNLVLGFIGLLVFVSSIAAWVSNLWSLATFIPLLAVSVRRLHDTNRTGWWVLLPLVPVIGAIILMVMMAMKGTEGENRFG